MTGKSNDKPSNAGKVLGHFEHEWGKGKRTIDVELRVSDNPVSMDQVRNDFAKIIAPILLEKIHSGEWADVAKKKSESTKKGDLTGRLKIGEDKSNVTIL